MHARSCSRAVLLAAVLLAPAVLASCSLPTSGGSEDILSAAAAPPLEKGGEEEWGPYEPTPNWPQPVRAVIQMRSVSTGSNGTPR